MAREDFGEQAGTHSLVMESLDGRSLAQLLGALDLQTRRLSPDVAASIAAQLADGLHAAHETRGDQGQPLDLVHRDVAPQNVLAAHHGHDEISDLGVSSVRGGAQIPASAQPTASGARAAEAPAP